MGVDIDPQAVAAATANAAANGLQGQARFLTGWNAVAGPFDVIAANIFLGPLVEMMQTLRRRLKPDGTLIASGIIATQERALTAGLEVGRAVRLLTHAGGRLGRTGCPARARCRGRAGPGIVCTAYM